MKHRWYLKPWQDVVYGLTDLDNGLAYWSNKVIARPDLRAEVVETKAIHRGVWNWLTKRYGCQKYLVFKPIGKPETKFRLGFISPSGVTKLCPVEQIIRDDLFAVRILTDPNKFFLVGNAKVELSEYEYFEPDTYLAEKHKNIIVY